MRNTAECVEAVAHLATGLGLVRQFRPNADAVFHVDDVAVLGEAVDQGGCQVIVLQKRTPFAKTQVGRNQRGFSDRKSTRLNSSHTVISYAVFCLKKKNHAEPYTV